MLFPSFLRMGKMRNSNSIWGRRGKKSIVCWRKSQVNPAKHIISKAAIRQNECKSHIFIYALSADETSPALAAPRHAITALLSCCFKCPCPPGWQPHFRSNADRAYNTLHFASKVVCQRDTLWKPFFVGMCSHTSSKMQNKRSQSAVKPQSD